MRGPARPMYLGFALFAVGLVLGWQAPSVWVVLLARLGQGVGLGTDQGPADAVEPGLPPNDGGAEARGEALGDEPALPDADDWAKVKDKRGHLAR